MPKPRVNTRVTNIFNTCECVLSHSFVSDSWDPMGCSPPGSPSMEFSRQEHWGGCRCLLQGLFPTQGSNLPAAPTLAGRFLPAEPPGKQYIT